MKRWAILVVLGVASCAPVPRVQQPAARDTAVLAEQATEQHLAYDAFLKQDDAIWRVGDRLSIANAALCGARTAYISGMHVATLATTPDHFRDAALVQFPDLAKKATVVYVDPGSDAERAGVATGDLVVAVDDAIIPGNQNAAAAISEEFQETHGKRPVILTLDRGNRTLTRTVSEVRACDYPMGIVKGRAINSYTDDHGIHVYEGMMQFIQSDDELAVILGHEMGHNLCGHLSAGIGTELALAFGDSAAIVPLEEQADHVGLYLMARAGYNVDAAPLFWRRFAVSAMPDAITRTTDHPAFPVRIVMLNKVIATIHAKEARGQPLLPPRMLAGTPSSPDVAAAFAAP